MLILMILLAGTVIRLYHLMIIGFDVPFRLGGLFYEFSLQIIKNNFWLPKIIPYYSEGGLPFAYPPLPFYIQAILIKILKPENYLTVNLLPPLFSVFSLISFVFLAKRVLKGKLSQVVAMLAFAMMPVAFSEQIEGQGLSESLGTLALIWFSFSLLADFEKKRYKSTLISGIMLGLCILSSPGSAYASVMIGIIFAFISVVKSIKYKTILPLINGLYIVIIGLALSSPYWLAVINNHGTEIYTASFSAQQDGLVRVFSAVKYNLFTGPLAWKSLLLLGLIEALLAKKLLFLYFFLLALIPREVWVMSLPLPLIIGYSMERWSRLSKDNPILMFLVITGVIFSSYINTKDNLKYLINLKSSLLTIEEISALKRMRVSIPEDGKVIVAGNDGLLEWSPNLLKREVVNSHFGLEWQPEEAKKALLVSSKLSKVDNIDELMSIYSGDQSKAEEVYMIITKNADYEKLIKSKKGNYDLNIIDEYDNLILGKISPANN